MIGLDTNGLARYFVVGTDADAATESERQAARRRWLGPGQSGWQTPIWYATTIMSVVRQHLVIGAMGDDPKSNSIIDETIGPGPNATILNHRTVWAWLPSAWPQSAADLQAIWNERCGVSGHAEDLGNALRLHPGSRA